jgi:hypothetical protein
MGNLKLVGVRMRTEKGGRQVLETKLVERDNRTCKRCGKNRRMQLSSMCLDCKNRDTIYKHETKRLKEITGKKL